MPSQLHEALLFLFRNRPGLAPELLSDVLHAELPAYTEARIDSADLTNVTPAEYHADLVVLLLDGRAVGAVIVELQLSRDRRKPFVWTSYATNLRARLELEVSLLVVAPDEAVAHWAAEPINLGGGNEFRAFVLGPSGVPEITDEGQAQAAPELAVLSATAHGQDEDTGKAVSIALAAQNASFALDEERSRLYLDLVMAALSEAARRELQSMDPAKYEYQSEFARRYVAQGKAEGIAVGKAEGRAELVARQLSLRFGPLTDEVQTRLLSASIDELDAIGERLLTARTLDEALQS